MAYKDLVPIGSALIIGSTSFGLGVVYAQWPYDLNTLWRYDPEAFDVSIKHYSQWAAAPMYVHYVFHFVMSLGLLGAFIKLYKPQEEAKYFEYGSLILYMIAIIIYLTNLRIGVNSAITGQWGDVDKNTGINVVAASVIMVLLVLLGVLILQGGLYYAEWYDNKLKVEFYKREAEESAAAAAADAKTASKVSTGSSTGTESKSKNAKKRSK